MNKEERIAKYGDAAYAKHLKAQRSWAKWWANAAPEAAKAKSHEQVGKGGKYYKKRLIYEQTGLQGDRNKIRRKHRCKYLSYKRIIAPRSQIHHEWLSGTAEYTGAALVEANQHMHGFVDVIEILEGNITLLTEEEIRKGER